MRFASGVAEGKDIAQTLQAVLKQVSSQAGKETPHLALLFVSILYRAEWGPILKHIRQELGGPLLIGCTAGGVLGVDKEMEFTPAISLAAAHLPGVGLHPFRVSPEDLGQEQGSGFWIEKLGATPTQDPVGILLAEPFSCDCMKLVANLNAAYPRMPLIGGLASGAQGPGENALFLNDEVIEEGAVGVGLTGNVMLETIVAQGCRPIGRPYIVTRAQENLILELAGLPATEQLRKLLLNLPSEDQQLARRALFLGVVMNEQKSEFRRGDFLIRNLVGLDPATGALAVGDRVGVGQTVQFQLRDARTSREDLEQLLTERIDSGKQLSSSGGFLFSCLGRGKDLYGEPNVDIGIIRKILGVFPIAGFFCNGEIGPVGGRNFVHGFTSSLGLFRPKSLRGGL